MSCFPLKYLVFATLFNWFSIVSLNAAELTLNVVAKNQKVGTLFIELYQLAALSADSKKVISSERFEFNPKAKTTSFKLSELPVGQLCIRMFLDQNNNQKLDLSAMGIPLEPVGFANNPTLVFGEPEIDKTCFELSDSNNLQTIELKSNKRRKKIKTK